MIGTNGNGKLGNWIVGLVAPPVLGVALGWVTVVNIRLGTHGEHIAVLQSQITDTRDELKRINDKLDQLIERKK